MYEILSSEQRNMISKMKEWVSGCKIENGKPIVIFKDGVPEEIKKIPAMLRNEV